MPPARRTSPHAARSVHEPVGRRSRVRLLVALAAVGLACLLIAGRLLQVQVLNASKYRADAAATDTRVITLQGLRGAILDRFGQPLAISELRPEVIADPYLVRDPNYEAARLGPILHVSTPTLSLKLSERSGYVVLGSDLPLAVGKAVEALDLPGITVEQAPQRFYPDGQLARPLIGSVDAAGLGASGLEYLYNSELEGRPGKLVEQVSPTGAPIAGGVIEDHPAQPGEDVELTLDPYLQYQAEQALARALVESKGKSGVALVMDTHTGALLAAAQLSQPSGSSSRPALPIPLGPSGDPLPTGAKTKVLQPVESTDDEAFTRVYEPGSVEKLVTVSAALTRGLVSPDEWFNIPSYYPVAGTDFHDAEPHPDERLSLTGILAQSSNIGAIEVVQRLGVAGLYPFISAYGLGKVTPIGFPGESPGIIPPPASLSGTTLATMSFGQGMSVTAIQMLTAFNTVANGGLYVTPHLLKAYVSRNGRVVQAVLPKARRVVPTRVAQEMTTMLEQVVATGTGTAAAVAPYAVAGKTGTAQLVHNGTYVPDRVVSSFAGYAPAQDPQVTVMVVVFDTDQYGAQAAAPAFSRITRDALADLGIPPMGPQPPAEPLAQPQPLANGAG